MHVFDSYARGATDPHDVDIEIELDQQDKRWISHFISAMSRSADPHTMFRRALVGSSRSCQRLFQVRDQLDFR